MVDGVAVEVVPTGPTLTADLQLNTQSKRLPGWDAMGITALIPPALDAVAEGTIAYFQVTMKVSFQLEDSQPAHDFHDAPIHSQCSAAMCRTGVSGPPNSVRASPTPAPATEEPAPLNSVTGRRPRLRTFATAWPIST